MTANLFKIPIEARLGILRHEAQALAFWDPEASEWVRHCLHCRATKRHPDGVSLACGSCRSEDDWEPRPMHLAVARAAQLVMQSARECWRPEQLEAAWARLRLGDRGCAT